MSVAGLDALLAPDGWPHASTPPVEPGDPGRFHALFGRDALICALQLLPARPGVARATLRALAALQGREVHEGTLEEPGKIGHEFRAAAPEVFVTSGWKGTGEFRYYATADATSWFLHLLAATADPALARELEPAWRAAGGWLERALERGGGLVRHAPGTWGGLSSRAGATRSRRRGARTRAPGSCIPTAPSRRGPSPTWTARRRPTPGSWRSGASPAIRTGTGGPPS
jgi:glycogen debranching enzyme